MPRILTKTGQQSEKMLKLPDVALQLVLDKLPGRDLSQLKLVSRDLRREADKVLKNRASECITALYRKQNGPKSFCYLRINEFECKGSAQLHQWKSEFTEAFDKADALTILRNYLHRDMFCIPSCAFLFIASLSTRLRGSRKFLSISNLMCPFFVAKIPHLPWCPKDLDITLDESNLLLYTYDLFGPGISAFFPNAHFANFRITITDMESAKSLHEIDEQYPLKGILLFCRPTISSIKFNRSISSHFERSSPVVGGLVCEDVCFKGSGCDPIISSNIVAVSFQGVGINIASVKISHLTKCDLTGIISKFKASLEFDPDMKNSREYTIGFLFTSFSAVFQPNWPNFLLKLAKTFPKTYFFGGSSYQRVISGISQHPLDLRRCCIHDFSYSDAQLILVNFKKTE